VLASIIACGQSKNGVMFTYRHAEWATSHKAERSRTLPERHAFADPEAMARQPRLDVPGVPQHMDRRGNN
ncbi:MAG: hypothetical protein ABI178_03165, partial [Rhodanobacter sp.]